MTKYEQIDFEQMSYEILDCHASEHITKALSNQLHKRIYMALVNETHWQINVKINEELLNE